MKLGAIVSGGKGTAAAKFDALSAAGEWELCTPLILKYYQKYEGWKHDLSYIVA